ncbi:MAG TPA: hypothetical protein VFS40_13785 [Gemmatimonadales bacterium]|nr:hypothetical protein [Gemmatimonadales bacterium]
MTHASGPKIPRSPHGSRLAALALLAALGLAPAAAAQEPRPAVGTPAATPAGTSVGTSASPAVARVAGRWLLVLEGGPVPGLRGELRLAPGAGDGLAGALRGTLAMASRDSAPLALAEARVDAGGRLEFLAPGDAPVRFTGHLVGDRLEGDALAHGERWHWSATRLSEAIEFYPTLPRFTLRQIVAGRRDSASVIPGAWLAAADAAGHTPAEARADYARAARAAGLAPIPDAALAREGLPYLMGGTRRAELAAAVRRTYEAVAAQLPEPRARAQFDRLFRPRGAWLVDLHDAALLAARRRVPDASWARAARPLVATGWLPRAAAADSGAIALSLYRLTAFASQDTAGYRRLESELVRADAAGAATVVALLAGYVEATAWYTEALGFFLDAPWLADSAARGRSLGDLMREFWGDDTLRAPRLRTAFFGYPQGLPQFGTPDALADRLVVPENDAARRWLARHGHPGLLRVLQRLGPAGDDTVGAPVTTVEIAGEPLRLTSVRRQARESTNGFLGAEDAVTLDPSYVPLLALGTLVHEWQHLVFERRRAALTGAAAAAVETDGGLTLQSADPVVAEGFAEWSSETVLAPVSARFPLVALGERLKRARMALVEPDDAHLLGYRLVCTLADPRASGALPRARLLDLLLDASTDARRVSAVPELAARWRAWAAAPARRVSAPSRRVLIPETRFTVEDDYPDPLALRIRFPRE